MPAVSPYPFGVPALRALRLPRLRAALGVLVACVSVLGGLNLGGCATKPGTPAYARRGDEIMVCGQLFHTGAPVVLWIDPGGYDAYRTEKRFGPLAKASWEATAKEGRGPETPARYNTRFFRFAETQPRFTGASGDAGISDEVIARVRGGGWSLPELQQVVDQFVLHYDVCGTSRQCFRVLQDVRGLSVHFMLDVDGTIYQTLDLKERAWHATSSNDRSIGIEIANIGAYPPHKEARTRAEAGGSPGDLIDPTWRLYDETGAIKLPETLERWYERDKDGWYVTLPDTMGDGGIRTPNFVARPKGGAGVGAGGLVVGQVQGRELVQFDLTPQQYDSLAKLTAALCKVFPNMPRDYPRDGEGKLITSRLSDEQLRGYRGILGHYHIQTDKTDPGPALRWDVVIGKE